MSDLIYQFSQSAHPGILTNIGQGVTQLVQQKRAKDAAAAREAAYQEAISSYRADKTPDNLFNIYNSAPEKFESFKQGFDAMNELQRTQTIQSNMEVMSHLTTGDDAGAIGKLETLRDSFEAGGETGDAREMQNFIDKIKNGQGDQVMDMLSMVSIATPEGREAFQSLLSMREDERSQVASEGKLFELAQNNPFATEEDKQRFYETAEGLNLRTAADLAELASVMSIGKEDPMSSNQFFQAETSVRKEYDAFTSDFNKMINSATQINRLAKEGSGFSDQGMIMLFNKVLDPPSVVRESEAKMTAENQGLVDRGRTYLASLKAGERLSDTARKELLQAVNVMSQLGVDQVNREKDRLKPVLDFYGFSEDRVFVGDEEDLDPTGGETTSVARTDSPEQVDSRLDALREHIITSNPNSSYTPDEIRTLSEDQIKTIFKNGYNAFLDRKIVGQTSDGQETVAAPWETE